MPELEHLSDDLLNGWFDGKLDPAEEREVRSHLEACPECERRLEHLDAAWQHYQRVRPTLLPAAPPQPWADPASLFRPPAAAPSRVWTLPARATRIFRPFVGAAIAAALLCGVLFWPHRDAMLRADTLLESARAVRPSRLPHAQLRLRTPRAFRLRPAVLSSRTTTDPELETLRLRFESAGYDWSDPLSAGAYAEWRGRLATKSDEVQVQDGRYVIHTATPQGPLHEAELTIDARTLLPERARLTFRAEDWVEITQAPDAVEPLAEPRHPARTETAEVMPQPVVSAAEREARVRLAIDALHVAIGEPIDVMVQPDGSITVVPYRLDPEGEQQLRSRLANIAGVTVRPVDRGQTSAGQRPTADETLDPAIAAANAIVSRAQLLRQFAERFPREVEASLSPASRRALHEVCLRHAHELESDVAALGQILARDRQALSSDPDSAAEPVSVASLTEAATAVNRLITTLRSNGNDANDPRWQAASSSLSRLRVLSNRYARVLEAAR